MKKVLPFLLLLSFSGCKKKNSGDCEFVQTDFYYNGTKQQFNTYSYDDKGRISQFLIHQAPKNDTVTYRYYADSIVLDYGASYAVYFLRPDGLASGGYLNLKVNPDQLYSEYKFTYNAEGYLVEFRDIFSQLYLGSIIKDTTYYYYTISGGNVVKETGNRSGELNFEYNTQLNDTRIPDLSSFPFRTGPFMGKRSRNLVSVIKDNTGARLSSFTYITDNSGKIIEKQIVPYIATNTASEKYIYNCN